MCGPELFGELAEGALDEPLVLRRRAFGQDVFGCGFAVGDLRQSAAHLFVFGGSSQDQVVS